MNAMTQTGRPSLMLIELGFTAVSIVFAIAWPSIGSAWFMRVERAFSRLARRRVVAVFSVGLSALLLRLALLPLSPIPKAFVPDDFSFLLAAKTFAAGRLTNPTPAMWIYFESFHITMQPTYMSMYFPAQGLILAAGKVFFGNSWLGLLCITAIMCGAICWMLQAWLPPTWALLGGMLAVLRISLFSYWINTYTGAGSVAALGGALVLGSFPRILRRARPPDCMILAVGIILLATSRPYEGFLLCLPVALALSRWVFVSKHCPTPAALLRLAVLPLALIVAAGLWMGYYDYRVNGSPWTPPYAINRAQYAVAPYWVWQNPSPEPAYRHKVMRDFYVKGELAAMEKRHSLAGLLAQTEFKPIMALRFFAGITLLPPLLMLPRVMLDRRIRFFLFSALLWVPGMVVIVFLIPHYLAPFTAAFYAIGMQLMRHLRAWRPARLAVGMAMVRLIVVSSIALAAMRALADPLHISYAQWPGPPDWTQNWSGPGAFGEKRARIEAELMFLPGKQLVFVRYSDKHDAIDEWVYNDPDIDSSKVIWAREMDPASNIQLSKYYKDRKVWLAQPDLSSDELSPYAASEGR